MLPTPPDAPSTSTRSSARDLAELVHDLPRGQPGDTHRGRLAQLDARGQVDHCGLRNDSGRAQTPSRAAPSASPATSTGRPSHSARSPHPERARKRAVGRDSASSDIAVDGVDPGERELHEHLALVGAASSTDSITSGSPCDFRRAARTVVEASVIAKSNCRYPDSGNGNIFAGMSHGRTSTRHFGSVTYCTSQRQPTPDLEKP